MDQATYRINITADVSAKVEVAREGDIITATIGRKNSISVPASIAPEKLTARRDAARADQSAVEVDPCDGYRSATRSVASKVEEAQMVALLRFLGVTEDAPCEVALSEARDYAERITTPVARADAARDALAILVSLDGSPTRDEVFSLLAQARALYNSKWVCAVHAAKSDAEMAAFMAAAPAPSEGPEDTSWGYAHGGTD